MSRKWSGIQTNRVHCQTMSKSLLIAYLELSCALSTWVATTGVSLLWGDALAVAPKLGLGHLIKMKAARTTTSLDDLLSRLLLDDPKTVVRAWKLAGDVGTLAATLVFMNMLTRTAAGCPAPLTSAAGVLTACAAAWATSLGISVQGARAVLVAWYGCSWLVSSEMRTLRRTAALHVAAATAAGVWAYYQEVLR
jgi:hypothetical protein